MDAANSFDTAIRDLRSAFDGAARDDGAGDTVGIISGGGGCSCGAEKSTEPETLLANTPNTVATRLHDYDQALVEFDLDGVIGSGTYGTVLAATHRRTGERRALKCTRTTECGVPCTTIREIAALRNAAGHPNVVRLIEVHATPSHVVMEMELMRYSLSRKLNSDGPMPPDVALRYTRQLLDALVYCHVRRVVHRDLKPENVLISADGETAKLCDFGMSRSMQYPCGNTTPTTATMWYRPPEGLLYIERQTPLVDVWSLGCVAAEMLTGEVTFRGDSEVGMMMLIFEALGTPDDHSWPGIKSTRCYNAEWPKFKGRIGGVRPKPANGGDDRGLGDFVSRALSYPKGRPTARAALRMSCFAHASS